MKFYQSTIVSILDTKIQKVETGQLDQFFFHHAFQCKQHKTDTYMSSEIIPEDGQEFLIKDLDGWTKIIKLEYVYADCRPLQWIQVNTDHSYIILSDDSKLLLFNPDDSQCEFHGRYTYAYHLYSVTDQSMEGKIRMIDLKDEKDQKIEFEEFHIKDPTIKEIEYHPGYIIETKSGFFNGNNLLLAASSNHIIRGYR